MSDVPAWAAARGWNKTIPIDISRKQLRAAERQARKEGVTVEEWLSRIAVPAFTAEIAAQKAVRQPLDGQRRH